MNFKEIPTPTRKLISQIACSTLFIDACAIGRAINYSRFLEFFVIETHEVSKNERICGKFIVFNPGEDSSIVIFESLYSNSQILSGFACINNCEEEELEIMKIVPFVQNPTEILVFTKSAIETMPVAIMCNKQVMGYITKEHWKILQNHFKRNCNIYL